MAGRGRVRWGLLATGAIARAFARGVQASQTGELTAVGSRTLAKARQFGEEFGIARRHGSYEALLADPEVAAVYISTPHPQHEEWTVRAAAAGKHVLVEKPIAVNRREAQIMLDAAARHRVFLMEAYMYRCHPQTARLVELLRGGAIGRICVISATFSFHAGFDADSRIWANRLAGGGILDVGGYTLSMARLIAGTELGRPFADPIAVTGAGSLHPETGVDAWAVGTLAFEGGIVAAVSAGVGVNQDNVVRIYGTGGSLVLPNPYVAARDGAVPGRILWNRNGEELREVVVESAVTSFTHEADVCGRAIRAGRLEADAPAMSWADTLGNISAQDAWRAAIGLTYEAERPAP